jgi:hypothetical protein
MPVKPIARIAMVPCLTGDRAILWPSSYERPRRDLNRGHFLPLLWLRCWLMHPLKNHPGAAHFSFKSKWMAIILARCQTSNPQSKSKMPTKKKSSATKLKVELKDLRPRKDAKGGAGSVGCLTKMQEGVLTTLCRLG